MPDLRVEAIDHLVLNVDDIDVSFEWYSNILGMRGKKIISGKSGVRKNLLFFGNQKINLRQKDISQKDWFTARRPLEGTADLCFLVSLSADDVVKHLTHHNVKIECGPVIKEGARGKISSVYCRDPDGNLIELSSYKEEIP